MKNSDNKYKMEIDVLEAAFDLGPILPGTPAAQSLDEAYPGQQDALTVVADYLIEERFLYPLFDSAGLQVRNGRARGITPKGMDRLNRLRHPTRTWIVENWFPVAVATTTALLGIVSIVVNAVT